MPCRYSYIPWQLDPHSLQLNPRWQLDPCTESHYSLTITAAEAALCMQLAHTALVALCMLDPH